MKRLFFGMALLCGAFAPATAQAQVSGAGATFPYPIYAKWADAYRRATGVTINYQSIGSSGGIQQIRNKTVTFGASDMPLKFADLERDHMVQFPTVLGGVVPVVNILGVKSGELVLDGPILAKIFRGEITAWNDSHIVNLNPRIVLPAQPIVVVHRSDGSGTTFLFTDYLSKVDPVWKDTVGANTAVAWPTGVGARGNEGVSNNVRQFHGSIGYVEYAYAKQNGIAVARMINKDGGVVAPSMDAFAAAATAADWGGMSGFDVVLTNQEGAQTWPITGATFILMYKNPQDKAASREALKFFTWAFESGAAMALELDYVPIQQVVFDKVWRMWRQEIHNQ